VTNSSAEERQVSRDPYGLSPVRGVDKAKVVLAHSTTYQNRTLWGGFWLMAPVNEPLVRRSWGLLQQADAQDRARAYGPAFSYREIFAAKSGLRAAVNTTFLYAFLASVGEYCDAVACVAAPPRPRANHLSHALTQRSSRLFGGC